MNSTLASLERARRKNPLRVTGRSVLNSAKESIWVPTRPTSARPSTVPTPKRRTRRLNYPEMVSAGRNAAEKQSAKRKTTGPRPACPVSVSFYVGSFNLL